MSQCPHINLASPDNYIGGVPFEWLRELRQKEPVFWQEDPQFETGGYWAITKHADLDFVSKNPLIFSSAERTCMMRDMPEESLALNRMILINMDPPDHIKHRRIVRNAFTPKVVDSYHERFKAIAKDIVDRVADSGRCEFVQDIAAELPLIAICELMAVPLDQRKKVFELTNIMIGADDPDLSTDESDGEKLNEEEFSTFF